MSTINGVGNGTYPLNPVTGSSKLNGATPADSSSPLTDKVELSGVQGYLNTLNAGGDVRTDKVASVRAQIEAGTYDEDHKLNFALDGLLDDVNN